MPPRLTKDPEDTEGFMDDDIAICVCAHNEEAMIGALLESMMQCDAVRQGSWPIYVMASGCTDGTVSEVNGVAQNFPSCEISVIAEPVRSGKVFSVNRFVRLSRAEIAIFTDADVLVGRGSLEALVAGLKADETIGISVALRGGQDPWTEFWGFCETVQALVHNHSEPPKVGRLYAIRRRFAHVDEQAVADDTFQEWACSAAGMRIVRVPLARLTNQGPRNVADYLGLRRRVIALHLNMFRRTRYQPATMRRGGMLAICWQYRRPRYAHWFAALLCLEAGALILAQWDARVRRREYVLWPIIESTKCFDSDGVATTSA